MKRDRAKGIYGPIGWFVAMLLLWGLGYPVYMYKGRYFGLKNRLAISLIIMVFFVVITSLLSYFIASAKSDLQKKILHTT